MRKFILKGILAVDNVHFLISYYTVIQVNCAKKETCVFIV